MPLQVESKPIRLPFLAPIVPSIRQDSHFEHRNGLHFLIGDGKMSMLEVEVACLLNEALNFDGFATIRELFTQICQCLFDGFSILAGSFRFRPWQDHSLGENGQHEGKLLLAFRLCTQDASRLLGFATPLPIPMGIT